MPPVSHPAATASLSLPRSVQRQDRLPSGSHPAEAVPLLPFSLCLFRRSTGCLPAVIQQRPRLSPSVCAEAVPVTFRQPSSSGRASLSLSLCRGRTDYLPTDRERERERGGPLLGGCREVTGTAAAQTKSDRGGPLLNGFREPTGTAQREMHGCPTFPFGRREAIF